MASSQSQVDIPPPPSTQEAQVRISREGVEIGVWPTSAIRPMIVAGELRPSDFYWIDGATDWQRLIPKPLTSATSYPYLGDDVPMYFLRDGLIFGPRTAAEIEALVESGWLTRETLMTFLGADEWQTIDEVMKQGGAPTPSSHCPANDGFDWLGNGIRACLGDPTARADIGMHAFKRAVTWFNEPDEADSVGPGEVTNLDEPASDDTAVIACPECQQKLRVPTDRGSLKVRCQACPAEFSFAPRP